MQNNSSETNLNNFYRLKDEEYNERYLEQLENDHFKIDVFYDKVLPSIATPIAGNRFVCLFDACARKEFRNKQTFFRHLQTIHRDEMPAKGSFLTPNSAYFDVQYCAHCNAKFARKDKLAEHQRDSKKCANRRKHSLTERATTRNDMVDRSREIKEEKSEIPKVLTSPVIEEDTQDELARLTQDSMHLNDDERSHENDHQTHWSEIESDFFAIIDATDDDDDDDDDMEATRSVKTIKKRKHSESSESDNSLHAVKSKRVKAETLDHSFSADDEEDRLLLEFCLTHGY